MAVGKLGMVWHVTAKGCLWRNGLAERLIRSARHTLSHELTRGATLDYLQFSSPLSLVSLILNSRPLSVRTTPDGDFLAVSPRDVILGRAVKSQRQLDLEIEQLQGFEDDQDLDHIDDSQAKIITEWRRKWMAQVFPDLVPRTKWKQEVRNLQVGDVGVLRYENKLGADSWHLARIKATMPDATGKVRTVQVEFHP